MMSYERLDVYQAAIKFLGVAVAVVDGLPKGQASVADQLRRASMSVPLNIAEGVGKRSAADRRRYFEIARGSAMECGAVLDVCFRTGLLSEQALIEGKEVLERIVAMLSKMSREPPRAKA